MRIGIDIMEAERFTDVDNERLAHIFTHHEIEYFYKKNMAPETIAGLFCAKEAFFKALGTGIAPSNVLEVEVLHDVRGAPFYKFGPRILADHRFLSTAQIQLSISNTKRMSVAVCVMITSDTIIPFSQR